MFEFSFPLADTYLKKIQAIDLLVEEDEGNITNDYIKEFLMNLFYICLRNFFQHNIKSENWSSYNLTPMIIVLFKIYTNFSKSTYFVTSEIQIIMKTLLYYERITLNDELKDVIRSPIYDYNSINTIFLNIIKDSLIKDFKNLSNDFIKIDLFKLIVKNENIIDFMKEELPKIIENLFTKDLYNEALKIDLFKLILENKVIFSNFIEEKLPQIIKNLLNQGLYGAYDEMHLFELLLDNIDLFNSVIEEMPKMIKSLFNNKTFDKLSVEYQINIIDMILNNQSHFQDTIILKEIIPNKISELLKYDDVDFINEIKDSSPAIKEQMELQQELKINEVEFKNQ